MKQIVTILIGLLWTSSLPGQIQNDVKKVLAQKDFVLFKRYAEGVSNKKNGISAYCEALRDLTTDFQEGVFFFKKSVPDQKNPDISSLYIFRVTIIATDSNIVYYELSEEKNKKVEDYWEPYYVPIDKFEDKRLFDSLKRSFKRIFHSDLNQNELFITGFVYGRHCGNAGVNPDGRQQIDEWVAKKDKSQLLKWLRSTNTEKQVYAVDGLLQLKKAGLKLTEGERRIIKFIINKKGAIYVCGGCMYSRQSISSVVKEWNYGKAVR